MVQPRARRISMLTLGGTAYFSGVFIVVMKLTNTPGTKGRTEDILYNTPTRSPSAPSPDMPKFNWTYANGMHESGAHISARVSTRMISFVRIVSGSKDRDAGTQRGLPPWTEKGKDIATLGLLPFLSDVKR